MVMKECVSVECTVRSVELSGSGGIIASADVQLHQQNKALSLDNSLSSGPGDNAQDHASASGTAASSPATLPMRQQQLSMSGSESTPARSCPSQGTSRASTLSSTHKKVNMVPKGMTVQMENCGKKEPDTDSEMDIEAAHETTALNLYIHADGGTDESLGSRVNMPPDHYLTMSGTITRGKRAGQQTDIKVNLSREEFEQISSRAKLKAELEESSNQRSGTRSSKCCTCCQSCGVKEGLHIWLWSFFCYPFVFLLAAFYSFYMGTLTWYNVFSWYTEEKPFLCRILMAPVLIISYPIYIVVVSLTLGVYSASNQLSCNWLMWLTRVQDLEKGFFAWLCSALGLEECSPYTEVVIVGQLDSIPSQNTLQINNH